MSRFKVPHIEEPSLRVRALRYFMTIFCAFFVVFGFGVITCGSILASQRPDGCLFASRFFTGVYLLLAGGCVTSFFSITTCVCIQRSSTSGDFIPLGVVALVVLVLQVMAAVAGHVSYVSADNGGLATKMEMAWENYYESDGQCIDNFQEENDCCGVHSHTEWQALSVETNSSVLYPASCLCTSDDSHCVETNATYSNMTHVITVHDSSCHSVLLDHVHETLLVVRVVGPLVSVVEVVFLLATIYFLRHIENRSLVGAYVVQPTGSAASARDQRSSSTGTNLQVRQPTAGHSGARQQGSLSLSCDETISHL